MMPRPRQMSVTLISYSYCARMATSFGSVNYDCEFGSLERSCFRGGLQMDIGDLIKNPRKAQGPSLKEVPLAVRINTINFSKIEGGKIDPAFSSSIKIAKAIAISSADLSKVIEPNKYANAVDKSLMVKVALIEPLDKKEMAAYQAVLDAFISKKKISDALNEALQGAK